MRIDLGTDKTLVMGILNRTPDSFSDGGAFSRLEDAIQRALAIEAEGADILDIGGESTRPGAQSISPQEEIDRVIPLIQALHGTLKIPISVDTVKSSVAELAIQSGAEMVNDISACRHDAGMPEVIKKYRVPVCLMHMQGEPRTMQLNPHYNDVVNDIKGFLLNAAEQLLQAGIEKSQIILDPGIGFGKTVEHNLTILAQLEQFTKSGYPVLVGLSRKSFIGKSLELPVEKRMFPSISSAVIAVWNGAKIVRVHDVQETVQALKIVDVIKKYRSGEC